MSRRLDPKQKELRSRPTKAIIKAGSSSAFYVMTLFYTMSVFFGALSSGSSFFTVYGNFLGRPDAISGLFDTDSLLRVAVLVLALAPGIMICAGLWLLSAHFRKKTSNPGGLLSMIKAAVVLQFSMIFILIAVIGAAIFNSFQFVRINQFAWGAEFTRGLSTVTLTVAFFGMIGLAAAMTVYFICIIRVIRMVADTMAAGERIGDIPSVLIYINYILAAFNLISAGADVVHGNGAAAVSAVCMTAFLVVTGASLSSLRQEL
jgi:hypothetical protein